LNADQGLPFSEQDLRQLRDHGVGESRARAQLQIFRQGQKPIGIERPATLNDGIIRLKDSDKLALKQAYSEAAASGRLLQFIPASGAATRMFKGLTAILLREDAPTLPALIQEAEQGGDAKEFLDWFTNLERFPFRSQLEAALRREGLGLSDLIRTENYRPILQYFLTEPGLGYGSLPKALIQFHLYPEGPRTALEEQLAEAARLVTDAQGLGRLHFTVSPEHEEMILGLLETVKKNYAAKGQLFKISLSKQSHDTDVLCVDGDLNPYRNRDNTLVLRPGGHGALLNNLQNSAGDIVFIKNIDNIVPERLRTEILEHRQSLCGHLLTLQTQVFAYLRRLLHCRLEASMSLALVQEISAFVEVNLGISLPNLKSLREQTEYLLKILHRPIRVCAMVKNQGEPGGGPFWVRHPDGSRRLQIVEDAQVDKNLPEHAQAMALATHFNPTDLVCGLRDYQGEMFQLQDFVDPDTYFITNKSKDGKPIHVLELPGLWNGSMAFWNTAFVEVPVETFNPVKSVNDLLRPSHQA
jgi:Domain of unknown function (DUF4301)